LPVAEYRLASSAWPPTLLADRETLTDFLLLRKALAEAAPWKEVSRRTPRRCRISRQGSKEMLDLVGEGGRRRRISSSGERRPTGTTTALPPPPDRLHPWAKTGREERERTMGKNKGGEEEEG
jgi:hypothetical protein